MLMPGLNPSSPVPGAATPDAVQGRTSQDAGDGFGKALSSLEKRASRQDNESADDQSQTSVDGQEEKPSRISVTSQTASKAAAFAIQGIAARAEDKAGEKVNLSQDGEGEKELAQDSKTAEAKSKTGEHLNAKTVKLSIKGDDTKDKATADTKADADTGDKVEVKTASEQDLGSVLSLLTGQQASAVSELAKQGGELAKQGGLSTSSTRSEGRNGDQKTGRVDTRSADAMLSQGVTGDAADALEMPGTSTTDADRTFRIFSQRGKASMDMTIGASTDGKMHFDVKQGGASGAEGVMVLDSRRFLGFNQSQNGAALTAAMSGDPEWASAMQPDSALSNAASQSSTGNVVNTLKLQMTPHSLGTVTATLKLVGDQLSVHLTVENRAAHHQLSQDSSGILDALRSQGFSVDHVTVSITPSHQSDNSQQGGDTSQQRGAMLGQQGNGGQGQGQPSGGQSGAAFNSGIETNDTVTDTRLAAAGSDARSGDIYL